MRVTLIPKNMQGSPITMEVSLILATFDNGTPFVVAGDYGPDGSVKASHAGCEDFNKTINDLGINRTVFCDTIQLPQPAPGAKLLYAPNNF